MEAQMYEILVPTVNNEKRPFRTRYHRQWDQRVYEIAGGVTILKPTKGKWIGPSGQLFEERMIPVRIVCTEEQIREIVQFTIKYYDQIAVLAYKVASQVILTYKEQ